MTPAGATLKSRVVGTPWRRTGSAAQVRSILLAKVLIRR